MNKVLSVIITALFLAVPSLAQTTAVSATVTGSNSVAYSNGTVTATLVDAGGNPISGATYISNSNPVAPTQTSTGLNSSGAFTVNLPQNALITPPGTQWQFNVCSASNAVNNPQFTGVLLPATTCFKGGPYTISGSTQSLTSQLSTLATPIYPCNANTGVGCGSGGGATLPTSAVVFGLTSTTSRAATNSDIGTLLASASGCSTSGNVYSPITNTCVSPGGGASLPSSAIVFGLTSTTSRAATTSDMSTLLGGAGSGGTACTITNSLYSPQANGCFTPAITNTGTAGNLGYYASTGSVVSPDTTFNLSNTTHVDTATNGFNTTQLVVAGTQPQVTDSSYANAGTGGSVPLFLNKLNSSGQVVEATTSDTAVALFVVGSSSDNGSSITSNGVTICQSGTSGNACIVHGKGTVTFDSGGGTIGHYCIESTSTGGTCHDSSNPSGISCAGMITQTVAANGTGVIDTTYCQPQSVSLGGTVNNSSTANLLAFYPSTGTTVQGDTNICDGCTTNTFSVASTAGTTSPFYSATGTQSASALGLKLGSNVGIYQSSSIIFFTTGSSTNPTSLIANANGFRTLSSNGLGWSNSTTTANATQDTSFCKVSAGITATESAATCTQTVAGATGGTVAAMFERGGTTFTTNAGCTDTALTGGASGGHLTVGTSSACTTVITMGNSSTAAHGWVCKAVDITTPANLVSESATTTTTVTLGGTFSTSDVIWFSCDAV